MASRDSCVACNGKMIEVNLSTGEGSFTLGKKGKWFTFGSSVTVYVCTQCARVALYADELYKLK